MNLRHPRVFDRKLDRLARLSVLAASTLIGLEATMLFIGSNGPQALIAMLQNTVDMERKDVMILNMLQSSIRSRLSIDLFSAGILILLLLLVRSLSKRWRGWHWGTAIAVLAVFVVDAFMPVVGAVSKIVVSVWGIDGYDLSVLATSGVMDDAMTVSLPSFALTNLGVLVLLPILVIWRLTWARFLGDKP